MEDKAKMGEYSPPFSPFSYNGDYPDGEEPTCDICGRAQDDPPCGYGDPDWNGETGNHASCEEQPDIAEPPSAFYPSTPDKHETEPDLSIRHDDDEQVCRACGKPPTYPERPDTAEETYRLDSGRWGALEG